MNETLISEALYVSIENAVAATSRPTIPVKFPGRQFKVSATEPWLEVVQIRNNSGELYWSDGKRYQGFVRLIVHFPNNDEGDMQLTTYADELNSKFKKGDILRNGGVNVKIENTPDLSSLIEDGNGIMVASTVRYGFFAF